MENNKKILITGGTGFIGKEIINLLKDTDYQCYIITRNKFSDYGNIHYIQGDIFDEIFIKKTIDNISPDTLLHLAWNVQAEDFSISEENLLWCKKSIILSKLFLQAGGKNLIAAGTCFEYDMTNNNILDENSECNPQSLYGKCKVDVYKELNLLCHNYCARLVWGRIFYPYGPQEERRKLISAAFDSFSNDKAFICKTPENYIDYIHVSDVARFFCEFISNKSISGAINLCTGNGVKICDLLRKVEFLCEKSNLLQFQDNGQRKYIVGSINKLKKYSLSCKITINDGLKTYL